MTLMLPMRIPIKRVAHTATHYVGRHERGLFMGSVLEVFPEQKKKPDHGTCYAVLHLFSDDGAYVTTQHFRLSSHERDGAFTRLGEMIRRLSAVSFEDISIAPFDTKIDGTLFGLVDATDAKGVSKVELRPLGIIFSEPWTGSHDEKET